MCGMNAFGSLMFFGMPLGITGDFNNYLKKKGLPRLVRYPLNTMLFVPLAIIEVGIIAALLIALIPYTIVSSMRSKSK